MRKKAILITGAAGEIGNALVKALAWDKEKLLLTLDLDPMPEDLHGVSTHIEGDILDQALLDRLVSEYEFDIIYHLAALLSTRGEFTPGQAHRVNVSGTMSLLRVAAEQSDWRGTPVQFIFPSSIAVYGFPDLESKKQYARVREWEWNYPRTMYGCNKLYCEMLGAYFSKHYRQLAAEQPVMLDFRALRFPGLISAHTIPSGGTSDYGPEMLHAGAQGKSYECFVRPDVQIPFMAMPDAVHALLQLSQVSMDKMSRRVYNVTSFSLTAAGFRERVLEAFPGVQITYNPDTKRQAIVDSWPADLDDSTARREWGWKPTYDIERAFNEYLIPNIRERYQN